MKNHNEFMKSQINAFAKQMAFKSIKAKIFVSIILVGIIFSRYISSSWTDNLIFLGELLAIPSVLLFMMYLDRKRREKNKIERNLDWLENTLGIAPKARSTVYIRYDSGVVEAIDNARLKNWNKDIKNSITHYAVGGKSGR